MHSLLEMRGVTKTFPGVVACNNIDLDVQAGEIHALLGENGAGKTTLMNVLYGLYEADKADIRLRGEPVTIQSPAAAIAHGIGMVHQHFTLVPVFTVAENILLGREPRTRSGAFDRRRAEEIVRELSREHGLAIDPGAKVEDLSVGLQQRVEILKALYGGADILILDEPTAVLTPQEADELMATLRELAGQGKAIILITHKLREVLAAADRITVIRRGEKIGTFVRAETSADELATAMVGRKVSLRVEKGAARPGEPVLTVENLSVTSSRGLPAVRGVSLEVRAGEIVGIAGVDGNGQTELVEALTGLRASAGGRITVRGEDITARTVRERRQIGLGHIPQDRQRRGLVLDFTVAENAILGRHDEPPFSRRRMLPWLQWLQFQPITAHARKLIGEFDVRPPDPDLRTASLSGGNQQKVIVARELDQEPHCLLAVQPTRGLDIGAIEFIHRRLIAARDDGRGVLLVSLELDEILALSDRILVMYEGRIVAELDRDEATEEKLGLYMAGGGDAA